MDAWFSGPDVVVVDDDGGAAGGGVGGVAGAVAGEDERLTRLKHTISGFVKSKELDEAALVEAQAELAILTDRVIELQAMKRSGGGGSSNAIAENDKAIAKHSELMEKRLVKARAARMGAIDHNARLRDKVNELRREKATIIMLGAALRDDAGVIGSDSAATQARISSLLARCEELDAQAEGLKEEARIEVASLELEYKRLGEDEKKEAARAAALETKAAAILAGEAGPGGEGGGIAITVTGAGAGGALGATGIGGISAGGSGHLARAAAATALGVPRGHPLHRPPPAAGGRLPPATAPAATSGSGAAPSSTSPTRPALNPADRPLSRQMASIIMTGKQPSLAELRMSARTSVSRGGAAPPAGGTTNGAGRAGPSSLGPGRSTGGGIASTTSLPAVPGRSLSPLRPTSASSARSGGGGGGVGRPIPSPKAGSTATQRLLNQSRWQAGMLEAKRSNTNMLTESLREAVQRAIAVTDSAGTDDFVTKFTDASRENEVLYSRVAAITAESDALRSQLVREWAAVAAEGEKAAWEDQERLSLIADVDVKVGGTKRKMARLKEETARLTALADAVRRGLQKLLEILQGEVGTIDDSASDRPGTAASGDGGKRGRSDTDAASGGAGGSVGAGAAVAAAAAGPPHPTGRDKQQQDIVSLFTRVETLLAVVLSMYSRHLHGLRMPLALPPSVLTQLLQQASAGMGGASSGSSLSRLLSMSPVPGAATDKVRAHVGMDGEAGHGAGKGGGRAANAAAAAAALESSLADEIPATRNGVVTMTASERRASLEMGLIDMRKGLLVEAAKTPAHATGRQPSRGTARTGRGATARSNTEVSAGSGPTVPSSPKPVAGSSPTPASPKPVGSGGRRGPSGSADRPDTGVSGRRAAPGGASPTSPVEPSPVSSLAGSGSKRAGRAPRDLQALNTSAPMHGGFAGDGGGGDGGGGGSGDPILDAAVLRVGPDSPSRAAMAAAAAGGGDAFSSFPGTGGAGVHSTLPRVGSRARMAASASALAGGVMVVPPPMDGAAAAQILAGAREDLAHAIGLSSQRHTTRALLALPSASSRSLTGSHGVAGGHSGAHLAGVAEEELFGGGGHVPTPKAASSAAAAVRRNSKITLAPLTAAGGGGGGSTMPVRSPMAAGGGGGATFGR